MYDQKLAANDWAISEDVPCAQCGAPRGRNIRFCDSCIREKLEWKQACKASRFSPVEPTTSDVNYSFAFTLGAIAVLMLCLIGIAAKLLFRF